ncbi:MAG: polysaccharide deacetylase family protein [Thermodesulfovibrionales bacterium]|nr:polysaccharide deacetylase family protein [Thermodesulfovibrionales bacterium]
MKSKHIILMYHNIGIPPINAPMKGLYVLPSMFRLQMRLLKMTGFKVVTINELLESLNSNKNGRFAALTFDDGYYDFYKNAMPILKEFKYPATVFVVPSLIGKSNEWDTKRYGGVIENLMTIEQIKEVQHHGITIGSHSYTHADLTSINYDVLKTEIEYSKKCIEGLIEKEVDLFCYPFGGCNDDAKTIVKESGYKFGIGSKRGSVMVDDDIYELRRIPIRLNTHPVMFLYKTLSNYEDKKGRGK